MSQIFKSKTIGFAVLLAVLSVFQGYVGRLPLDPTEQMYIGMFVAIAIAVLRVITTQPLSEK
jgi:magnesium-transporting ATPase (P-type)